ncbi:hypothetical protein ON010_g9587 [Phytophthora cinnamomi]|nr:hypothetical protein ON010_g9587 [Phytophthora cinnamomi]
MLLLSDKRIPWSAALRRCLLPVVNAVVVDLCGCQATMNRVIFLPESCVPRHLDTKSGDRGGRYEDAQVFERCRAVADAFEHQTPAKCADIAAGPYKPGRSPRERWQHVRNDTIGTAGAGLHENAEEDQERDAGGQVRGRAVQVQEDSLASKCEELDSDSAFHTTAAVAYVGEISTECAGKQAHQAKEG